MGQVDEANGCARWICVFFLCWAVFMSSMNATACYFVTGMEHENAEIARGLRRRDADLLDRLIEQYQHRLLRYLVYLAGNRELAEDLFQETWIRVLERGHQYDGKHEFSTWLYAVARNLTIDYLRKKSLVSLDGMIDGLMEDERHPPPEPADTRPMAWEIAHQRGTDALGLLMLLHNFPRHGSGIGRFGRRMTFVLHQPVDHPVPADQTFLPQIINRQIPRHRVEPRAEFVLAIVLMAAFQHANPGFLEEVLGQFTIS